MKVTYSYPSIKVTLGILESAVALSIRIDGDILNKSLRGWTCLFFNFGCLFVFLGLRQASENMDEKINPANSLHILSARSMILLYFSSLLQSSFQAFY